MGLTTALAIGGIASSALGAAGQASSSRAQAEYMADIAELNAEIARQDARDVELRGRVAEYDQRRQVARSLSSVRAATAGAGLVVDEAGTTPQDYVDAMAQAGELDVMRLRNNIEREKRRLQVQATQASAQGAQYSAQAASIDPLRSGLTAGFGALTQPATMDILF